MGIPDVINGAFELFAGMAVLMHCRALWRDKEVKGVSMPATIFFLSWGIWNLFYYPQLGQWVSFTGGIAVLAANILWIGLMIYFKTHPPVKMVDVPHSHNY